MLCFFLIAVALAVGLSVEPPHGLSPSYCSETPYAVGNGISSFEDQKIKAQGREVILPEFPSPSFLALSCLLFLTLSLREVHIRLREKDGYTRETMKAAELVGQRAERQMRGP